LLKFLAARGTVDLATLADEPVREDDQQRLGELCQRVAIVPLGRMGRWLRAAASLARGKSATEGLFYSAELHGIVQQWSRENRYDAVVVFCSSMMPYALLPEFQKARLLVDLVDVDSQKWFDYAAMASFPRRQLFAWEGRRVRQLECQIVDRADAVILTSPQEAALLRGFKPTERARGVSNGVDLDYYFPRVKADDAHRALCVFVGVLDYRANVDGLRWFCSEVWPEVRRRIPDAVLRIVGRRPGAMVLALSKIKGVQVVGEVPDTRPYVAGAEMSIAPLRVARGIQNKVLEAMAMGRTVVATPQALEGISLEPNVHIVEARTPEEWVATIVRLHGDAAERDRLGAAARAMVERCYTWENCLAPVEGLLGMATEEVDC